MTVDRTSGFDSGVTWFNDGDLRRLAGARSYERAAGYVGAISGLEELPDGVLAVVHGSEAYQVRLFERGGELAGQCSCPYGRDGAFCKHCVAVGFALLSDAAAGAAFEPAPRMGGEGPRAKAGLRTYLLSLEPVELVDLLVNFAADNPTVHRRLSLRAAAAGDPDTGELRRLVDTLRPRGFVDYDGAFDYARKADDVLDALDTLARDHPESVGQLYRRVVRHVTKTSEQADDSDGAIGDAAGRAVDGYAAACRAAPPDPAELAHWLIDVQLDGPGWPDIDIADFADALGDHGLTAYWRRLTDLTAGQGRPTARFDHRTFTIRHLREGYLTSITKDVDALVALYAEDLSEPYQYVRIADALRTAGRREDAIAWLARGRTGAARPDDRIENLLAELHTEIGRYDHALDLRWELFARRLDVPSHRALLDAAERAGVLAETADRATTLMRERAIRGGYAADPLVAILLASVVSR